jgi:hypothetical protein
MRGPHHALRSAGPATTAVLAAAVALATVTAPVAGQDFTTPAPAWPPDTPCALLERALPAVAVAPALEGAVTRWHGLDALTTRAAAAAFGWRALRAGLGLAQTGEPDIGWTALGLAIGAARRDGGAALRAAARRDRTTPFGFDDRGAAVGVEVGGGAWIDAAAGLHVWASAPQVWTRGAAPPLARPLEIGGAVDLGGVAAWLSLVAVAGHPRGGPGEHSAGLATDVGPLAVWLIARDQPLRGGLGVAGRARGLRAAAEVESHPVLGETARIALGLGGGR